MRFQKKRNRQPANINPTFKTVSKNSNSQFYKNFQEQK